MVRPVDTTGKGKAARRSSLLIEEDGAQREVDIGQFIDFCAEKPEWLFEKFLLDHDKYEDLLTERDKVIAGQRERIEQFEANTEAVNPIETPEYAELQRKFNDLKRKIKEKDAAIQKLVNEANQMRQVIVQNVLQMQQQSREVSPAISLNQGESSRRSAKVTEPPTFTGTQEGDKDAVSFEFWELRVRDRLAANADHFPTAALRLAAVKGWCSGEAANHLIRRSKPDSDDPYTDAEDVIQHLKLIYDDVNKEEKAKAKFRKLTMKPRDNFQKFLSEFTYNAQESGEPRSNWKAELYRRLPTLLQNQVMSSYHDKTIDFGKFSRRCTIFANSIEEQQTAKQEARQQNQQRKQVATPKTPSAMPAARSDKKPDDQAPKQAKVVDRSKITCFNCKQLGHFASECPLKKKPDLKAVELNSDSESGKEYP